MDNAIIVNNITKKYKLYSDTKERLFDLLPFKSYGEDFYALKGVNFVADHGEVIGFVGTNGSGKSTLSNIIAGIVPETGGTVKVNGQVSLIAVSAGLKNDLTGRDNIELKLLMLGFDKKEILNLEEEIIEFSELGKFIDQPVKSYSSGMKSRLGFSISVSVDPDILIIDEALSVGDKAFAEKSLDKMNEFKQDGKTMIFVSHSLGQMKKFCDKILWLEYGRVKMYGSVEEVLPEYEAFLKMWKTLSKKNRMKYREKAEANTLDHEKFLEKVYEKKRDPEYEEKVISRMGRIRAGESLIYKSPDDMEKLSSSKSYKKSAYYIKKQVIFRDEKFFLISTEPSALHGVIGWIKATDIASYNHVQIDYDKKVFSLEGTGSAYDRPWGSKNNITYDEMESKKGLLFHVERTDKVGKSLWYYGYIENHDEKVWIHSKNMEIVEESLRA